jgi:hypothetical protein
VSSCSLGLSQGSGAVAQAPDEGSNASMDKAVQNSPEGVGGAADVVAAIFDIECDSAIVRPF